MSPGRFVSSWELGLHHVCLGGTVQPLTGRSTGIFLTPTRKFSHFTEGRPRPLRLSNQLGLLELAMCHPGLPLGSVLCVLLLKALANDNS